MVTIRAFILSFVVPFFVSGSANALTIEQVAIANAALGQLNCGNRTVKEAGGEKQICEAYKWSTSTTWDIATLQQRFAEVVTKYNKIRSEAIANLDRKPDGAPTEKAIADFNVRDRAMLDMDANVQIIKLKRSELEAMNLQPAVVAALMPIIAE